LRRCEDWFFQQALLLETCSLGRGIFRLIGGVGSFLNYVTNHPRRKRKTSNGYQ